jgi:hypothetical protein
MSVLPISFIGYIPLIPTLACIVVLNNKKSVKFSYFIELVLSDEFSALKLPLKI